MPPHHVKGARPQGLGGGGRWWKGGAVGSRPHTRARAPPPLREHGTPLHSFRAPPAPPGPHWPRASQTSAPVKSRRHRGRTAHAHRPDGRHIRLGCTKQRTRDGPTRGGAPTSCTDITLSSTGLRGWWGGRAALEGEGGLKGAFQSGCNSRGGLKGTKGLRNANINKRSRGCSLLPGQGTFSTSKVGGWRLAVGGWRLVVPGGSA